MTIGIVEERHGEALRWVIDNPKRRNAIRPEALRWIARRAAQLDGEVVVLTGDPFCSGFDLTALGGVDADPIPDTPLIEATTAMAAANATFVAALHQYAIGAGVELVCACDVRLTTPDAYFSMPVRQLGLVYHPAGLRRIHAALGTTTTKRLVMLGDRVEAAQAAAAGADLMLTDDIETATATVAANLAGAAPDAMRAHRELLRTLASGAEPTPELLASHAQARATAYARLRGR